ncbi:MAG: PD40 domain-containing protein [Bacteroidales bacterium]|nr:PD40 domain-containing protein [Bacteroidales bacterium]
MRSIGTLIILCLLLVPEIAGQFNEAYRADWLEGEMYFLFEEYNEALPYYRRCLQKAPKNDDINFKLGVCYLNDPFQKETSIEYLEKAVKNINLKYKENNIKETAAPMEALFYLGNAYRINNQLDKAIETYVKFREKADPDVFDHVLVDEQIRACNNAKDLQNRPIDYDIVNIGDRINSRFPDVNPVVSGDETRMVYTQEQAFYDALFYSEKVDGEWSYPRLLMPELGIDDDAYPTALSYDGTELLVYRSDNFIGDLYSTRLVDGFWTPLKKLNDNINTKYWESHACFTRTGDSLYFTSNRKGTLGGLDIYLSTRENGNWGNPANLGPNVNTIYNEETPFVTFDGKTLYFSSYGHYNMGGYDVFYSTRLDNGQWSKPINAGYPINTTDDDFFYQPVQNGVFAYLPRLMDDGFGRTDIYRLEIYSKTHPRKFQIRGLVNLPADALITKPITVTVIERYSRDTVAVTYADPESGAFTFEAPSGEYDLVIEGDEIEATSTSLFVPEDYLEKELEMKSAILLTLVRKLDELEPRILDKIKIRDTLIVVSVDDPIEIPMTLERNAELFVSVYQDTNLVRTDSFQVDRRRFTYTYVPLPGKTILKLKMVDSDGNLSFKNVVVIYTPEEIIGSRVLIDEDSVELDTDTTEVYAELDHFHQNLIENADGMLKEFLTGLDLKAEGIESEEELLEYLKEKAITEGYSSQDVYDLILTTIQYKYIEGYLDQLLHLTDNENIIAALTDTDLNEEKITSLQELYDALMDKSEQYGFTTDDLNQLFSQLSQRTELIHLLQNLTELAEGDLKTVLEQLDPDKEGIKNTIDLIQYLLENAEDYDYTRENAMSLLFNYLEKEDLAEIMKVMIGTASGELQELLINMNLDQLGIGSLSELYAYLLNQAKFHNFTEADVDALFINLLNVLERNELIRKVDPVDFKGDTGIRSGLIYYLLGAGLLLIIFFLLLRRRRNRES